MNETIFRFFNDFALKNEFLDASIIFFADSFGYFLIVVLIVFIFFHKPAKTGLKHALVIFTPTLIALLAAKTIKFFYFSPRPFEVLDGVNLLFKHGGIDSFPSGHAAFFSALAVSFYINHKRLAIIYIAGAVLIGISRIAAGIHWPTDVLAGYAIGGIIGFAAYKLLAIR